jgi:hypothetical protein
MTEQCGIYIFDARKKIKNKNVLLACQHAYGFNDLDQESFLNAWTNFDLIFV